MENNKKTILLVDDDEHFTSLTSYLFRSEGYNTITARDGKSAIEIVNKNETIDLIVMDINLGAGMDGIETAQEILKNHNIPIVFLSAHTEDEIVNKIEKTTPFGYIFKNSPGSVIIASIKMALKLFDSHKEVLENEKNFYMLAENANDGIIISDPNGNHLYANKKMVEITGYSVDELLKIKMNELAHPDEVPKLAERLRRRTAGEKVPSQYETAIVRKDGKTAIVEINSALTFWHNQPSVIVIVHDITERKRMEKELIKSIDELNQRVKERTEEISKANEILNQKSRILSSLVSISLKISNISNDYEDVINLLTNDLMSIGNCDVASLLLLKEDENIMFIDSYHTLTENFISIIKNKFFEALKAHSAVMSNDVLARDIKIKQINTLRSWNNLPHYTSKIINSKDDIKSRVFLPLEIDKTKEIIGLLYLGSLQENVFDTQIIQFFISICNQLASAIQKANLYQTVERQSVELREINEELKRMEEGYHFENIIGDSKEMTNVYQLIRKVAESKSSCLILGESGTGKELVARAIHNRSARKHKPFICVDCNTLTESLLESELFGHIKGSFTGAISDKEGLFEVADGGTIFLDEIGNISLSTQAKLLRVLETGEIKRVGSNKIKKIDVRIIAATNIDIQNAVNEGKFRDDLFYRLNVVCIKLPPLRERKEDIPLLAYNFLRKYSQAMNKQVKEISLPALQMLMSYNYPGNIRELENIIERAIIFVDGDVILPEHILSSIPDTELITSIRSFIDDKKFKSQAFVQNFRKAKEVFTKEYLTRILRDANGVPAQAAKLAGMDKSNFAKMLKRYKIK